MLQDRCIFRLQLFTKRPEQVVIQFISGLQDQKKSPQASMHIGEKEGWS